MNKTKKNVIILITLFCIYISLLFMTAGGVQAYAAGSIKEQYEARNVLTDLEGSYIGDRLFNVEDYPYSADAEPSVLLFAEYGYSFKPELQNDYDLYLYVYNPGDKVFFEDNNQIEMAVGEGTNDTYPLQYLNRSERPGYEGRFYKYKIVISLVQRVTFLRDLNSGERVYKIAALELNVGGTPTNYEIIQTYTYSGFSMGYGSELMTESTLSCVADSLDVFARLNVKHTVYRPQGDFYDGVQSQMNSCYFRVPEKFFSDYGRLEKILCEWYEYITNPVLVTESEQLSELLSALNGASNRELAGEKSFFVQTYTNAVTALWGLIHITGTDGYFTDMGDVAGYHYFTKDGKTLNSFEYEQLTAGPGGYDKAGHYNIPENQYVDSFSSVFYTNGAYTDKYISAEELELQLWANSLALGDTSIAGKFSEDLFCDYVNTGHTRGYNKKLILRDDEREIFTNTTTQDFWQRFWGGYTTTTNVFDNVKAIVTVEEDDLKGSNKDISDRLYVNVNDVDSVKAEYSLAAKNNEKLVLLRFGESEYRCLPCRSFVHTRAADDEETLSALLADRFFSSNARNGYVAQETVYLNFDIISLWFNLDGVDTVVPVLSSPTNAIAGIDPPLSEDYHTGGGSCAGSCLGSGCSSTCSKGFNIVFYVFILLLCLIIVLLFVKVVFRIFKPKNKDEANVNVYVDSGKQKATKSKQNSTRKNRGKQVKKNNDNGNRRNARRR